MKKYVSNILIIICIVVAVCLIPFPRADVNIWLYLDEMNEEMVDSFDGFYSYRDTDGALTNHLQCVSDMENKRIRFIVPGEYASAVQTVRFDFPCIDELLMINNIAVSSGGFIQKQLDPSRFLTDANIIFMNDINGFSDNEASCRVAISTGSTDPYLVLSDAATGYLMKQQSHYMLTRFAIGILIAMGIICFKRIKWGKNIYTA